MQKLKAFHAGAIALALAQASCGVVPTDEAEPLNLSSPIYTTLPILTDPVRGQDPTAIHGSLYQVSVAVTTDTPANPTSLVYYHQGPPSFSTWAPADKLRVGLESVIERNGSLFLGPPPVTCQVGDYRDGGDLFGVNGGGEFWTRPGSLYTTCAKNPDQPDIVGKPIQFNAPVQVAMNEKLYLYLRLEVLNGGTVWSQGSDPNAGVPGALNGLGGAFSSLGALLPDTPVGAVAQGLGTVLSWAGQFTAGPQHGPQPVCQIPSSLVPGFAQNQPPSDNESNLLRVPIDGRQLYELTAKGDAGLDYDLDWRPDPQTTFCLQNRPRTHVTFRIRRVMMTGDPGSPQIAQGGLVAAPYPDRYDSFATDCNGAVIHEQRGGDSQQPLAWTKGDTVPSGGPAPNGRITALSRTPGHLDLFAINANGDLVSNWRNKWVDNNQWHNWFPLTSGGKFPPGAPVAAVSRYPDHMDVFMVAKDESIQSVWFDSNGGWRGQFPVSPAGEIPAWDGVKGGGITAVARSKDNLDVFAVAHDWQVATGWWSSGNNWNYTKDISPLWVRPGSEIASVSRNSHNIEVLYVDGYAKLQALEWNNSWGQPMQVVPDAIKLPYAAPITIVSRKVNAVGDPVIDNDHLDAYVVDSNGKVAHTPWRYGDDNYRWNPAHTEELAQIGLPGAQIGAAAPEAGRMQVAIKKIDSTMGHTWYEDVENLSPNWQNGDVWDGNGTQPCGNICCGNGASCVSGACCAAGKECGTVCCGGYDYCGGGGVAGKCGCTPKKCEADSCGTFSDGCGGTVSCGTCASTFDTCYYNQCIPKFCVPKKCPVGQWWNPDECHCQTGRPM